MPIYEYRCLKCGAHVEKMQKVSEEPLQTCEKCGGKLEKQWSLSGFQFKGAGWYVTDYANKSNVATAEKGEKSETVEKSSAGEKNSPAESTAKTETASNKSNDTAATAANSPKETVSKKE